LDEVVARRLACVVTSVCSVVYQEVYPYKMLIGNAKSPGPIFCFIISKFRTEHTPEL
jgi:hypothetical protein